MKFSIITLTLNSEKTILSTLRSIKSQKNVITQHIILDGESTDQTQKIIKKYKEKKTLFVIKKNKNVYNALNDAIKFCKNEIVGILHSDDTYFSKNTLNEVKNIFLNTHANIVYGDIIYVRKYKNKIIRNWVSNTKNYTRVLKKDDYRNLINNGWMPPHTSLFIKKNLLKKIGNYNESYRISSDYDFIIRIFKHKNLKVYYQPKTLIVMKTGGLSNKSIKNIAIKFMEDLTIIKNNNLGGYKTLFFKIFSKIKQFI
jgi:glycosyltransferase involved in cell wall biosynthesis